MKQVTYEIRGLVIETMIPAIAASCESLDGVKNIRITVKDTDRASLTMILESEPDTSLETDLAAILRAKGLELCLPACEERSEDVPTPPAEKTVWTAPPKSAGRYVSSPPPKEGRQISLTAALSTVITAVVLAVLLTFSLTRGYMKNNSPHVVTPEQGTTENAFSDPLTILDRLFRKESVLGLEMDEKTLIAGALKGYIAATGDVYAEYLTPEEAEEQNASNKGEMCGIGVNVVESVLTVNGVTYQVITISSVFPDSPALEAGVLPGDHIMYVGTGEDKTLVHDIGYTEALARMKGTEGTECAFTVFRRPAGSSEGTPYEEVEITATRKKLTTRSVIFRHYTEDETVGIIKITGFDYTTRDQLVEAVETLKAEGCESFVLDLRGNPGGLLSAVEDVLVFFLQEDDTLATFRYVGDRKTTHTVTRNRAGKLLCGSGELTAEDIGKYRDLNFSVLVNGYSASAAELFTSNIRDYELGKIVGTTTFGKGVGQTTMDLSAYGFEGALRLTTFYYDPPCGEGYHGIGITPHVVVELSEEAQKYNINILPDNLDNQLAAAVEALK